MVQSASGHPRCNRFPLLATVWLGVAGLVPGAVPAVKTVDFLAARKLAVNAAGPLLVRSDPPRNRIVLANTITASVSLIDTRTQAVTNIATRSRIPQYLKAEAMAVNRRTGDIYLAAEQSLVVVYPERNTSVAIPLDRQFESVAVDERTGEAYLAGRESNRIARVDPGRGKIGWLPLGGREERSGNLNQTPPPPPRKVLVDEELGQVIAIDAYAATVTLFPARDGQPAKSRPLDLPPGGRWHLAGYNDRTHRLYLVIESETRQVTRAAAIDIAGGRDQVVALPGLTEGVGIAYNARADEVYIPYDNEPTVHVVDFKAGGRVEEIKVPAYGNDATAVDEAGGRLFVASWAYAEVEVIDLGQRRLQHRIPNLGILPHMFNMAWDAASRRLYIPLGATAVNGSFGSAVTCLDPATGQTSKIRTGWAPVDLIQITGKEDFLVVGSEDDCAVVRPDGSLSTRTLPCPYPLNTVRVKDGRIGISYGAHQSSWPVFYIRGARNGLLLLNPDDFSCYDRRLPRMAQRLALDSTGAVWALQNNWGREKQLLAVLDDEVREFDPGKRVEPGDEVERETSQRLLQYDSALDRLYVVRVAEADPANGVFQIIDRKSRKLLHRAETGLTPADLALDDRFIYVANFDGDTLSVWDRSDFTPRTVATGSQPLKLAAGAGRLFVIHHGGRSLGELDPGTLQLTSFPIPFPGTPDAVFFHQGLAYLAVHAPDSLRIIAFDPAAKRFQLIHEAAYPYGEVTFATGNSAFFMRGQFADGIFEITRFQADNHGRLWVTDFLSGKMFIIPGAGESRK